MPSQEMPSARRLTAVMPKMVATKNENKNENKNKRTSKSGCLFMASPPR